MKRSIAPELSNEAFDAWLAASDRDEAIAAAADEVGGPRLSLVPVTERDTPWPTDLLPPAPGADPAPGTASPPAPPAPASTATQPPKSTLRAELVEAPAEGIATPPPQTSVRAERTDGVAIAPLADPAPDSDAAPDPAAAPAPLPAPLAAEPFDGIALPDSRKRLAGWSAERQRLFLVNLAETGSVHLAAATARLSARSAYMLRTRSPAFAAAWDTAEQLAVGRLSALAFDRAINGRVEQVWEHGMLVLEKRVPSDRVLMWLLARLDPRRYAAPSEQRADAPDPQADARTAFAGQLDAIADLPSG